MRLNQEMQLQGRWLFRWRSYLPLVFLVLLIPAVVSYRPLESYYVGLLWEIGCLFVGLFGMAIRCSVTGYAPANTSGRNSKEQIAETLNTKGMYSLIRNPLYLGNFFIGSAPILLLHAWWLYVIYVLAFALYYERIILTEEAFLCQKFGTDYEQWSAETSAFFPRHFRWQNPDLPFSGKHVLRREYHGLFALVAAMAAVKFVCDFHTRNPVSFDPFWMVIFAVSAVVYIVVRVLAKFTHFLHVEGR